MAFFDVHLGLRSLWLPVLAAGFAFGFVLILTPLVIRLAHARGWVSQPRPDRWHKKPTALMGGVALYGATALALLLIIGRLPLWFAAGATLMFGLGAIDDRFDLHPAVKLLVQFVAAGLPLYAGFLFGSLWPIWVSVPLTFLWLVGITNAVNLIDGMDGLAAGTTAIAATVLAIVTWSMGQPMMACISAALAGASAGFLLFNFHPARIFMGDSGSLFLGYMLAALSLQVQGRATGSAQFFILLVPIAVLALPIFDVVLVSVMRLLYRRPITQGGRDHTMHRLAMLGFSERQTVLVLYGFSLLAGTFALLTFFTRDWLLYVIALFILLALGMFGAYLGGYDVYGADRRSAPDLPNRRRQLSLTLNMLLGREWKAIAGMAVDMLIVIGAYLLAYRLRFENGLSEPLEQLLVNSLPVVVGVKLTVFYAFGLYRAIWRHAGTPEIIRVVKATAMAVLVGYVVVGSLFGFKLLSRNVLLIDWMIVTLAVAGVRLGFRGIEQYVYAQRKRAGRRVFLYGAGRAGLLLLREVRQNAALGMRPLGFIDDDPLKKGMWVQGLTVLGTCEDLEALCREHGIEEVVISAFRMPDSRRVEIADHCAALGIACRSFEMRFVDPGERAAPHAFVLDDPGSVLPSN